MFVIPIIIKARVHSPNYHLQVDDVCGVDAEAFDEYEWHTTINRYCDQDVQLMMLDSLDMTKGDREVIIKACKTTPSKKIVITHGTDTMVETAIKIAHENIDKTIVLVGAMIPYVFKHTNANFNMGFALAAAQIKKLGVYIAMNGTLFNQDKVVKNKELLEFQWLFSALLSLKRC